MKYVAILGGNHMYTASLSWREKEKKFYDELKEFLSNEGYVSQVAMFARDHVHPLAWIVHGRCVKEIPNIPKSDPVFILDDHLPPGHINSDGSPSNKHFKLTNSVKTALTEFLVKI